MGTDGYLCCGCDHTIIRCDHSDGSRHIHNQKFGIDHLPEVRSAKGPSASILKQNVPIVHDERESVRELCNIGLHGSVNYWRLWGFDDDEVDKAAWQCWLSAPRTDRRRRGHAL